MTAPPSVVEVVAAVIEHGGRVLITRRPPGTHLAGLWEFPGGKCEPGEPAADALEREIREELGARVTVGEVIDTVEWPYPEKRVRISFFRCALDGEIAPPQGLEMAWVSRDELPGYAFPAADAALIARLSHG
jgi:mutator protein MutT